MNPDEIVLPAEEPMVDDLLTETAEPAPLLEEDALSVSEPETAEEGTPTVTRADEPTEEVPAEPSAEEEEDHLSRLADEFLALCEEMEDIHSPEDLPDEVWETAAHGVPLRDAYLRFWYKEYIRCRKATDTRERTAATAVGSLKSTPADPRPAEVAFARSFQTAVE